MPKCRVAIDLERVDIHDALVFEDAVVAELWGKDLDGYRLHDLLGTLRLSDGYQALFFHDDGVSLESIHDDILWVEHLL